MRRAYRIGRPIFRQELHSMEIGAFLIVIATGIAVMILSLLLDHLWAQVLPVRFLYYILRCPGVVVHECSHILGCILTGASIKKVVFFSKEGGSVTYTKPKIPVIGDVIISTAPLFVIPLVLFALTWCLPGSWTAPSRSFRHPSVPWIQRTASS